MRTETGTQLKIYRMSSSTFTHWPVFDPAVRFSKIALRTVVVNSVRTAEWAETFSSRHRRCA